MPALSEHVNVHSTAIAILRDKGYQVWKTEQYGGTYWAEKDGWDFLADSPISLLGLVAIYEHTAPSEFRDYWWRAENPVSLSDTPDHPIPYVSVIHRKK